VEKALDYEYTDSKLESCLKNNAALASMTQTEVFALKGIVTTSTD